MTCVIVEDEIRAKDVLERYIEKVDYLELVGHCHDGLEALEKVPKLNPDILFLDINMPNLNGIELLKILNHKPKVIITTAYTEFAVESYDFDVVDYLVKPIEFSKFLRAVTRIQPPIQNLIKEEVPNGSEDNSEYSLFKSGSKTYKINYNEILYLEKDGNYLEMYLESGTKVLMRSNMSNVFNLVPTSRFMRVHKSFVVNLEKIKILEVNKITLLNNSKIPLGASFRDDLNKRIASIS